MSHSTSVRPAGSGLQCGFTMIELMVAITVALFLLAGVFASLQSTRQAFGNQSALAQMQDNERLAMTLMADVIESAGYYPNPLTNQQGLVLPANATFLTAGQSVIGSYGGGAAPGDTITVRFGAGQINGAGIGDNAMNCLGGQNTTVAPYDVFINKFHVDATTKALWCQSTTAAGTKDVQIVNGIQNLAILYGVMRSGGVSGSCSDTYLRADQMANTDWPNVCSVRVTLTFTNNLNSVNAAANPIVISRTIAIMNMAGVSG